MPELKLAVTAEKQTALQELAERQGKTAEQLAAELLASSLLRVESVTGELAPHS